MAVLEINPEYQEFLQRYELADAGRLVDLPGVIICGHPQRHVRQVQLGKGRATMAAILKREHRITWRERLANAWAGFGFVSAARREASLLRQLQRAGVPCSEWIAAGEDDQGRAFLLLRAVSNAVDLAQFLRHQRQAAPGWRRRFARYLGAQLAHVHEAGFGHPGLFAKHLLINLNDHSLCLLDWHRSRKRMDVPWPERWRDLAALHATLAGALSEPRERLACLRAYMRACIPIRAPRPFRRAAMQRIEVRARALLRQRRVVEQRRTPSGIGAQQLVWLDGENLCVSPEFQTALGQALPANAHAWEAIVDEQAFRQEEPEATLFHLRTSQPFKQLWSRLTGKPGASVALAAAKLLLRLQRQGVGTPRLLAVGQRPAGPWEMESFLLTAPPADAVPLADWLAERCGAHLWTAQRKQRWRVLRETAGLLRQLHESGCFLFAPDGQAIDGRAAGFSPAVAQPATKQPLQIQVGRGMTPSVVLGDAGVVLAPRRPALALRLHDLRSLFDSLPSSLRSRTDSLRFFLAYAGIVRLDPGSRRLARRILASERAAPLPVAEPITTARAQPVRSRAWSGSPLSVSSEREVRG